MTDRWADRAFKIFYTNYKSLTGYHNHINFLYEGVMLDNLDAIRDMLDFLAESASTTSPRVIYRYRKTNDLYIQTDGTGKLLIDHLSDYFSLNGIAMFDVLDIPFLNEHEISIPRVVGTDKNIQTKGLTLVKVTKPLLSPQYVPFSAAPSHVKGQFRDAYELAKGSLFVRMVNSYTPE